MIEKSITNLDEIAFFIKPLNSGNKYPLNPF
jgi:hypothetical protein